MEIILKQDIAGLGYKNDTISVKPGYGRNYLIPNGFAVVANSSNKKIHAENLKQAAHKAEKIKNDALALAESLEKLAKVELKTKVGENGRIFGSVTPLQVADVLKSNGLDVDRKKIVFKDTNIKEVGEYEVSIDLHKEVKSEIKVAVVSE